MAEKRKERNNKSRIPKMEIDEKNTTRGVQKR